MNIWYFNKNIKKINFLDVSETFINSMAFALPKKYNFVFCTTKHTIKKVKISILGKLSRKQIFTCIVINTAYLQLKLFFLRNLVILAHFCSCRLFHWWLYFPFLIIYTWIYDTDQYEALNRIVFCGSHILTTKVLLQWCC